jgi:hypothetical protein
MLLDSIEPPEKDMKDKTPRGRPVLSIIRGGTTYRLYKDGNTLRMFVAGRDGFEAGYVSEPTVSAMEAAIDSFEEEMLSLEAEHRTPVRSKRSELEALMRNYTEYQRDLPPWARGPG